MKVTTKVGHLAAVDSPTNLEVKVNDHYFHTLIEVWDEIERSTIHKLYKELLISLASGKTAEDMSADHNVDINALRTKISKAKAAYRVVAS